VKQVYSHRRGITSYYTPPFEEQNQPGNISGKSTENSKQEIKEHFFAEFFPFQRPLAKKLTSF